MSNENNEISSVNPLTETLDHIKEEVDGAKVSFKDILISLNHRGFGPLMMAPAIFVLLPTGALPGVPAVCGACLCVIGAQVVAGRDYPWIPKKLGNVSIRRTRLFAMIEKARPTMRFIDRFVDERLTFLSNRYVELLIALICLLLGAAMVVVGFIPFLPSLLALPVLMFALGTTARDGIMMLAGFALTVAAAIFIFVMSGGAGGEDHLNIKIGQPIFIAQPDYTVDINLLDNFR